MHAKLMTAVVAAVAVAAPVMAQDALRIGASLPLTGNFAVSGEKHEQVY